MPFKLPIQCCNHYVIFFIKKNFAYNTNQKVITSCDLLYIFPDSLYFKYLLFNCEDVEFYNYIYWLKFINKVAKIVDLKNDCLARKKTKEDIQTAVVV